MTKPKTVHYRRRREGRTNYKQRLKQLLAHKPRMVVRITNQKIIAQIVEYHPQGDTIKVGADSLQLQKLGWQYSSKNIPSAYLLGLQVGKLAHKAGIREAILDVGSRNPLKKGRIYALLKGALDGGLSIPHKDESIFPSAERLQGNDVASYAQQLKGTSKELYERRFAQYLKKKCPPEDMHTAVVSVKGKIMKS